MLCQHCLDATEILNIRINLVSFPKSLHDLVLSPSWTFAILTIFYGCLLQDFQFLIITHKFTLVGPPTPAISHKLGMCPSFQTQPFASITCLVPMCSYAFIVNVSVLKRTNKLFRDVKTDDFPEIFPHFEPLRWCPWLAQLVSNYFNEDLW